MRRIPIELAEPGIVLRRAVVDGEGDIILGAGERLTEENIGRLKGAFSRDLLIEDGSMTSPGQTPIFTPELEAHTMQVLNALEMMQQATGKTQISERDLADLTACVTRLVDRVYPEIQGEGDFVGADSTMGSDYVHPVRVAEVALVVGRLAGLTPVQLRSLGMACLLMNVGYLVLRRSLLDEPRQLEEAEWEEHVHRHPRASVQMLAQSELSPDALRAIAHHHERWDGSGYPQRLREEQICIEARIMAIADTYISVRSQRPFRKAMSARDALKVLKDDRGVLFDPALVDLFADTVSQYQTTVTQQHGGIAASGASDDDDAADTRVRHRPNAAPEAVDQARRAVAETDDRHGDERTRPQRRERDLARYGVRPVAGASTAPAAMRAAASRARSTGAQRAGARRGARGRRAIASYGAPGVAVVPVPEARRRRGSLFSAAVYLGVGGLEVGG